MALVKITLPAARKNANLSQKDLADICHVSESTVYNWENGKTEPTVTQAKTIAEATGIPLDCIVFLPKNTVKP